MHQSSSDVGVEITPASVPVEETNGCGNELSPADIRHNMIVLMLIEVIWGLGSTEIALAANPLYAYLNASNTTVGLIQSLMFLGLIGVFLSPWITRRFRVKKWYLFVVHLPYLGAWGAIGIALVLSHHFGFDKAWLLRFILLMSAANWFFAGFVTLPHNEYAAACIPMSHRGRFSGYSCTVGSLIGIASNAVGGVILVQVAKPMSYGYLYILTWLICQAGYIFALFGRERPAPVEKIPKPWSKQMITAALNDKPYMRVLILGTMSGILLSPLLINFVSLYGFKELAMAPAMAAVIGLIQKVAAIVTSPFLGHAIDRFSAKRFLMYWPVMAFLSILSLILLRNQCGVLVSSAFAMVYLCGQQAAINVLNYGLPSPENRVGHFTLGILMIYAGGAVGPLMIGAMCDRLHYQPTFVLMAALALIMVPVSMYMLAPLSEKAEDYN